LQEHFGAQLQIERRAFPLRPAPQASTPFRGTRREATWRRIAAMVKPDGIDWKLWERDDYPHWSLPALEAAKCAALQSTRASDDMHFRLFRGFFEQGVNIARPEEVLELARQAPLDYDRFVTDFEAGITRQAILDEYAEAVHTYMVYAIPTVIFNGEDSIVGAVPSAEYEKVLEKLGLS
jgi:predicted DsbA family dithiol-disulfide isomerase